MQIHELNNFTGTLGAGAYLAVDDGNDTGKLSTQQLLAATEARIDNIIAGPAPSAEEIVDARYGADGVTYPSLGDAIRDQVTDLKSELTDFQNNILSFGRVSNSYAATNGDLLPYNGWDRTDYTRCDAYSKLVINSLGPESAFNCFYNANKEFVSSFTVKVGKNTYDVPPTAKYFICSNTGLAMNSLVIETQQRTMSDDTLSKVDDLKAEIPVVSGNSYGGEYTANYYVNQANGNLVSDSGWNATDYIPLDSGETYYIVGPVSTFSFACYNSGKDFVDVRSNADVCTNNNIKSKIIVPSNVRYLRLSFNDVAGLKMICVSKLANADQYTTNKEFYQCKNEYASNGFAFVDGKYNPAFFISGTLGTDHNPSTYSNTNTACSAEMFYAPYNMTASVLGGTISVSLFDSDGEFESDTGFVSTPISIPRGKNYKINIRSASADTKENIVALATVTADSMNQYNDLFVPSCLKTILFQCRDGKVTNSVPPDSVYSIKMTAENQYDIIRFSAVKTTDDKYVAVHDVYINDLATNPDGSAISSTIYTADCSLAELNNYDWGLKFGQQYAGLQVPMLEDCVKYATMYGLAVAIDFKFVPTDADIDNISAMLSKYSQLNAILITLSITNMQKFHNKSPLFSFDFGGTEEQIEANVYWFNRLKGNHNRIYINAFPFGEPPTDSAIALAMANDLDIWFTPIEGIEELKSVGFNHGIKLYECHYITNIKSTVRAYADSLIG